MIYKVPVVYILATQRNGTLYVGVTSDLIRRIWQHKNKVVNGFSRKYNVYMLVYYELHETIDSAITREKQLKGGSRAKKLKIIEGMNPNWKDLYDEITG